MRKLWHQWFGCPEWAIEQREASVGDSSRATLQSCYRCGSHSWSWSERWVHDLITPLPRLYPTEEEERQRREFEKQHPELTINKRAEDWGK